MSNKQKNIPDGWKEEKLGNFCTFAQGVQIPYSDQIKQPREGYIRYLYIRDFFTNQFTCYIKDNYPNKIMNIDDLMMVNTGNTAGKVFSGASGVLSNNAFKIIFNNKKVLRDFLWYFLTSKRTQGMIKRFFNIGGQPHVGHKNVAFVKLHLPPIPEQRHIVQVLQIWDSYLEQLDKKIKLKKNIKKGLMQQLLTGAKRLQGFKQWKKKVVGEVFNYIKTYSFSRDNLINGEILNQGIGNIHYGDIHSTYQSTSIDLSNVLIPKIKDANFEPNQNDLLKNGDIVMADASEDFEGVGVAITIHGLENKKVIGGSHTFVLRDAKNLTTEYYRQFIFLKNEIKTQLKKIATGVSVLGISKTNLSKIKILLPNISEQTAIANILTTADKEIETLQKKCDFVAQQKKFLLNNLITGEIRLPEFKN